MKRRLPAFFMVLMVAACNGNSPGSLAPESEPRAETIDSSQCEMAANAASDFYQPPNPLPAGNPGDVIRCKPIQTIHSLQATGTLVMYLSTDVHGDPIAVTGVVFEPRQPWREDGPRPLVGYTHGTYGQGQQCSSSKLMAALVHIDPLLDMFLAYESLILPDLLAKGYAVAVTDYHRFATPGVHSYLNRIEEAHANIDMVRAAKRLPTANIDSLGPVAFMGYSQGGQAAAATAELLPSYGAELDVAGIYAGAVPHDIPQLVDYLEGGALMGVVGYYMNGLAELYPEIEPALDEALKDAGKRLRSATAEQCAFETGVAYGFQQTRGFTSSGQKLAEILSTAPFDQYVSRDTLGHTAPHAPVLLAIGANDDIVPAAGTRQLKQEWCEKGANVEYFEIPLPALPLPGTFAIHALNMPAIYFGKAGQWLQDRFEDKPFDSSCP